MNVDLVSILSKTGQSVVDRIRQNLSSTGTNASGKTSQSLRYQVTTVGDKARLRVIGRPFFMTVETGRKATPGKKPSYDFVANIREWLVSRGSDVGAAYAIALNINKKGTKLWRSGGRKDIVSNVVNEDLINDIEMEVLRQFVLAYINVIKPNTA